MRRRDFTIGLLSAGAARAAGAQEAGKKRRIAIIVPAARAADITEAGGLFYWRAFFGELRRLGDIEGKNLVVERYGAEGHPERYPDLVRQALSSRPDLILAGGNSIARLVQSATRTIPIVGLLWDPLKNGLVKSLARPGGNLTGVSLDPGLELYAKPLQLLKEAVPSASRVAFLIMRHTWQGPWVAYARAASRRLGISLIEEPLAEGTSAAIRNAFAAALRERPDAVFFSGDAEFYIHRRQLFEEIEKNHLPAIFQGPQFVAEGGLMSYSVDWAENLRRCARVVHRVLAGAKPGDIPISQPTKFLLAINLRTARALGVTFSPSLIALADEVIS